MVGHNDVHPLPPANVRRDGQGNLVIPVVPVRASLEAQMRKAQSNLPNAKVAGPGDEAALSSASKSDMQTVRVLGEGAFGLVDLCLVEQHDGTSPLLCVRKKLLKQNEQNNNDPSLEVQFLEATRGCPFVVQMWSHVVGLYDYTLLLEYCPYSSLDRLLEHVNESRSRTGNACFDCMSDRLLRMERHAGLTEEEARFYIACCVLGLESLHSRGILHRDLKPSNLLVADNGYVKLGDLGLCKQLGEEQKAFSHAGTPCYMAPEVVHASGKSGYSFPADMWSLGIMLWELVDGLLPKWAPMSWYWTKLHFPEKFSQELRSLLSGLLDKGAKERMKLSELRGHPWFKGFDWGQLEAGRMKAPDVPELKGLHMHAHLLPTTNSSSV